MTGHILSETQNPSFLTTLQATMTILDDISTQIDENAYLTLANNLQQLYTIHTSYYPPITRPTSPTSIISSVTSVSSVSSGSSVSSVSSVPSTSNRPIINYDLSGNIDNNTNNDNNTNYNNNLNIINYGHDININNFRDIPILIPIPFRLDRN